MRGKFWEREADARVALMSLRKKGVLIIGNGNLVHNLVIIDYYIDAAPLDWAVKFDQKVKQSLLNEDDKALLNYTNFGEEARLAVPTLDHYLLMVYTLALQLRGEPVKFIHDCFQHGSVSIGAFQIVRQNYQ